MCALFAFSRVRVSVCVHARFELMRACTIVLSLLLRALRECVLQCSPYAVEVALDVRTCACNMLVPLCVRSVWIRLSTWCVSVCSHIPSTFAWQFARGRTAKEFLHCRSVAAMTQSIALSAARRKAHHAPHYVSTAHAYIVKRGSERLLACLHLKCEL